jgi:hypothetical protein
LQAMLRRAAVLQPAFLDHLGLLVIELGEFTPRPLREVSNRALALIDEKNGEVQRSFIGGVVGSAVSIGESIAGLFGGSEPAPKKRRSRKTRAGAAE